MADDPLHLFSPDGATAVTLGAISSLVAGLMDGVGGARLFAATIGGALVAAVTVPVALDRGYSWQNWVGVVAILSGVFAGVLFGLANIVKRQWLTKHGDEVADGLWALTIGRWLKSTTKDGK